jgi:hypothetical protein
MHYEIASVVSLPRNDIATQSLGKGEGEGLTKWFLTDMSTIKFDGFREKSGDASCPSKMQKGRTKSSISS